MQQNPLKIFESWHQEAVQVASQNPHLPHADVPHVMTLATATRKGIPSARIVLFRGLDSKGIRFFTNYQSRKGTELEKNPAASAVFYWPELNRQVRMDGKIQKLTKKESDAYWVTRPRDSQIGAHASDQSRPIQNREELLEKILVLQNRFADKPVPRPTYWGGYRLTPYRIEFWSAGEFRIHDRYCYEKKGSKWRMVQLSP